MTAHQQWWFTQPAYAFVQGDTAPPPASVFVEQFVTGLTAYTSGGPDSPWSLRTPGTFGGESASMYYASVHHGYTGTNYIDRALGAPVSFNRLEFKSRINTEGEDDACVLSLRLSGATILAFNPRREGAYDGTRRPEFQFHGGVYQIGSTAWPVNTPFKVKLSVEPGEGATYIEAMNLITSEVVGQFISGDHGADFTFDALRFNDDYAAGSSTTEYDDIFCYNE